jgi:hypothetical protein
LLDALPAFTPDETYDRLAAYGEAGRQNYSLRNVTVDVLLPFSVFHLLFLLIWRATARSSLRPLPIRVLLTVPVAYVSLDLLENGSVLALLAGYPERLSSDSAHRLAAPCTPVAPDVPRNHCTPTDDDAIVEAKASTRFQHAVSRRCSRGCGVRAGK